MIDLRQEGDGYCHPHESISTPDEQQSPAWIARVVCQPVRNVEMRSDGIDIWRRFDTLLMSNDLVCAVTYEPVSDSTMGINRANSRIRALFAILQDKMPPCRRRFG